MSTCKCSNRCQWSCKKANLQWSDLPCAALSCWGILSQSGLKCLHEQSGSFHQWLLQWAEGWKRLETTGGSRSRESVSHKGEKSRTVWQNVIRLYVCLDCTLYFCITSFVKPYLEENHLKYCSFGSSCFTCVHFFLLIFLWNPPKIHDVVFMVPSVQVHVVRVEEKVGEEEHNHFYGLFPTIYKITIKHIGGLCWRKAILGTGKNDITVIQHILNINGIETGFEFEWTVKIALPYKIWVIGHQGAHADHLSQAETKSRGLESTDNPTLLLHKSSIRAHASILEIWNFFSIMQILNWHWVDGSYHI